MFIMTVAINTGTSLLHIKHGESGGREGVMGHAPSPPTEPAAAVTPKEPHELLTHILMPRHSHNHKNYKQ